ncbi:MAG: ribonuclease PH [Actinobacteria bacterium]|nr:ribonuclease PH [Actinomycetota bacterium]
MRVDEQRDASNDESVRHDGRKPTELRPVAFELGVQRFAEGSAMVDFGDTRVLCSASVLPDVPRWLRGSGGGWVTAEYAMLPRATAERTRREVSSGRPRGRTQEIQRLIGRALRSVIDLEALGERAIVVDCDVLVADGGTRTASITGGWVALSLALDALVANGDLNTVPTLDPLAAISVGIVDGVSVLDLDYHEDVGAQVDMNVVATADGRIVEVQGTAEGAPFSREQLDELLDLALVGCRQLTLAQAAALRDDSA